LLGAAETPLAGAAPAAGTIIAANIITINNVLNHFAFMNDLLLTVWILVQ
jgi:hypothetical protein